MTYSYKSSVCVQGGKLPERLLYNLKPTPQKSLFSIFIFFLANFGPSILRKKKKKKSTFQCKWKYTVALEIHASRITNLTGKYKLTSKLNLLLFYP